MNSAVSSDSLDSGGITLKGTTDKTITYNNTDGVWETNIGFTVTGTISDSIGPLRKLGSNTQSAAYTLVASDAGKYVAQSSNSASVTVPNGVFAAGDMVTIVNLTATNINIVQGSGLDLNFTADGTTGTRTWHKRCVYYLVCEFWYIICSGSGLLRRYLDMMQQIFIGLGGGGTESYWYATIGDSNSNGGNDVAIDSDGNVYTSGASNKISS